MMKRIFLTVAAVAAMMTANAAPDETSMGTCTWIGPASGGSWDDPANWSTDSQTYTVAQLLATNCSFVISALADGAELTNNMVDRPITGLTYDPGASRTITLKGQKSLLRGVSETRIIVGTGAKIIWKMDHPNNWNTKDGSKKIVLAGSGTLTLDPPSDMSFYLREIQPCHTTTLEIGANCWFKLSYIRQWDNSRVRLVGKDITVAQMITTHSDCSLDLNGNNLYICGGETPYAIADPASAYMGTISGTGNITVSGGQTYNITGTWNYSGYLALSTSSVKFRPGFAFPSTVEPIVNANGSFVFPASETLCGLRGAGVTGGVKMPDNSTLTLAKGPKDVSVFAGRITGDSVEKRGADFTQVFTGDNAYTGATTVAEGTLILRRPIARKGLVAYWPFDDADDDIGRDYGPNGFNLTKNIMGNAVASQRVDGVKGPALDLADNGSGSGSTYYRISGLTRAAGFPLANDPVSISLWAKPRTSANHQYLFRYGNWGGNGAQMTLWIYNQQVITCVNNWSTSDAANSPVYTKTNLRDGNWHHFAITYANRRLRVYYDGVMQKEKTTTCDLAIPENVPLMFGNNDSGNDYTHRYFGGVDEAAIYDYELTAEEVAAEYNRAKPDVVNSAAVLPDPLCHWSFDDSSAPGKDSMGNADLVVNPAINKAVATGGNLSWDSSMILPAANLPAGFPSGKDPFTVSVRLFPGGPQENFDVLRLGDNGNNNHNNTTNGLTIWYASCPRRLTVTAGDKKVQWSHSGNSTTDADAWTHVVVVCEPANRMMRLFRDGRLEATYTDLSANTFITAADLRLNCKPDGTSKTNVTLDDVRIYNTALTAGEVYTLSRTLKTGVLGPTISPESPVTVASGAELKVEGLGHEFKSLAGAGTLNLRGPSELKLNDGAAFTGAVTGPGKLVVAGKVGGTVSTPVELLSNCVFSASSLPLVTTSGKLTIPYKGTIAFDTDKPNKSYVIATGASVDAAEGFAEGWNTNLSDSYTTRFELKNGVFSMRLRYRATSIFFR